MIAGYDFGIGGKTSSTDKLNYSTEAVSSTSINVGTVNYANAVSNSGTAGYVMGAYSDGGSVTTIYKIAFSGDTVSTPGATLSVSREWGGPFANSGTAGYVAGGSMGGGRTSTDKLTFSSDTRSTIASSMGNAIYQQTAFANSGTAGYNVGGNNGGSPTSALTSIHKLTFSNDTWTTYVATLSTQLDQGPGGFANSGTAGYVGGGKDRKSTRLNSSY